MCVAALAWNAHPRWRLIAIGNRDEFHERPTAALARWPDEPDHPSGVIAGRDLRSGGTWLGVSEAGRFALVTNLRGYGEPDPARASRGALVTDLLAGSGRYADPARAPLGDFNPFNLICAGPGAALFLTNRPEPLRTPLAAGIYGLSNGSLDEPWPKTLALKAALLGWLTGSAETPAELFTVLASEAPPEAGLLPAAPSDIAIEPRDTAPFIRHPVYGTRCSTIVAIGSDGRGTVAERRFDAAGAPSGETALGFRWPVAPSADC